MITEGMDEFETVAAWLESNLRPCHDMPVERVRFCKMEWYDRLEDALSHHSRAVHTAWHDVGTVGNEYDPLVPYSGFYGTLLMDLMVRKNDVYDNPYKKDIFAGVPIHQINQSGLQTGREKGIWKAEALVSERAPIKIILEGTQTFRFTVFMYGDDWPDLADSFRVRSMLSRAA